MVTVLSLFEVNQLTDGKFLQKKNKNKTQARFRSSIEKFDFNSNRNTIDIEVDDRVSETRTQLDN